MYFKLPQKSTLFKNIITLVKYQNTFAETINQIVKRSKKYNFTNIAEIESKGFVFVYEISYFLKKLLLC